jgi:hypothetical protein
MSVVISNHQQPARLPRCARRVRHEAKDALAVFAFSAAASCALAAVITVVVTLAG